jgi:3-methyladenine DNA glycosylase AlkD
VPTAAPARRALAAAISEEVRAFCVAKADPERARRYTRYFTEGYDAYGVNYKDPAWAEHQRGWIARLRAEGPTAFLDAGDLLVASGKYEEASFAILFAAELRDLYTANAFDRLGRWLDGGIRNWAHTDILSGDVLARFLIDKVVDIDALRPWCDSEWKFKRRAVPVTLVSLLERDRPAEPMLELLEPLRRDRERFVRQALAWFDRELTKRTRRQAC